MRQQTQAFKNTPLDTSAIPQSVLNIEAKSRSNPLPWNGQFSPQLIQALLQEYASPDSILLDPFVGSGTVLLEAAISGLQAYGAEINPAAIILSRLYYFSNSTIEFRQECIQSIGVALTHHFSDDGPLFRSEPVQSEEATKRALLALAMDSRNPHHKLLLDALIVLVDFHMHELSPGKVFTVWSKLCNLILSLPYSKHAIEVFHTDARRIPLPNQSIDLIVTSPPYINVFNYHQRYRASTESLNWNLLTVAKSEFGSNRKHRSNRFFTVIQYALDMAQALHEFVRLSKSRSRLILIVGRESNVCGTRFYNGEIVAEIACGALGYNLILRQERVFTNRFGQSIYEDILHFSPPREAPLDDDYLGSAQLIASSVLKAASKTAPQGARVLISNALQDYKGISPSPLFNQDNALNTAGAGE